jgi:Uma2 family endonuclease
MRAAMSESLRTTSLEEYLAAEQERDKRHELVSGRIYVMAGGTERHELMRDAIYSRWRAGAPLPPAAGP